MTQRKSSGTIRKKRPPVQGTIELCRSAEGHMYFSARIGDEHRRWRVHPEGEMWLEDYGYTVGMKITGSTASYMRKLDLVYTLKPTVKQPVKQGNPLHRLVRDTERFEKKRAEDNERYPALMEEKRTRGKA